MRIGINFMAEEHGRLQWLLRERYSDSKAGLSTLAKKAIREIGDQQAKVELRKMGLTKLEVEKKGER